MSRVRSYLCSRNPGGQAVYPWLTRRGKAELLRPAPHFCAFDWGRGCDAGGARSLAFAMIQDATQTSLAWAFYAELGDSFVARLSPTASVITISADAIRDWAVGRMLEWTLPEALLADFDDRERTAAQALQGWIVGARGQNL